MLGLAWRLPSLTGLTCLLLAYAEQPGAAPRTLPETWMGIGVETVFVPPTTVASERFSLPCPTTFEGAHEDLFTNPRLFQALTERPGALPPTTSPAPERAALRYEFQWARRVLQPDLRSLIDGAGRVTSWFGWRSHPVTHRRSFHQGIDVPAMPGATIHALAAGVVERSADLGNLGLCVVLRHAAGRRSIYGHCSALLVKVGATVSRGQAIATVGKSGRATGYHVHVALRTNGVFVDPLELLGS